MYVGRLRMNPQQKAVDISLSIHYIKPDICLILTQHDNLHIYTDLSVDNTHKKNKDMFVPFVLFFIHESTRIKNQCLSKTCENISLSVKVQHGYCLSSKSLDKKQMFNKL